MQSFDGVTPFARAARNVIELVLGTVPTADDAKKQASCFTTQQVTVIAGVSGDVAGSVMYGMSLDTARNIAAAMMGEEVGELDDMAMSAVSELGNMITGSATALVSDYGYRVDVAPPSVIKGTSVEIVTRSGGQVVAMHTSAGYLEMTVAVGPNPLRKAA